MSLRLGFPSLGCEICRSTLTTGSRRFVSDEIFRYFSDNVNCKTQNYLFVYSKKSSSPKETFNGLIAKPSEE